MEAEDREQRQESETAGENTAGENDAAGSLPAVEEQVEMEDTQVDTQVCFLLALSYLF